MFLQKNRNFGKEALTVFFCLFAASVIYGQANNPIRSYRPDEMVSFHRNVPLGTALEILSTFSQANEGRIVIYTNVGGLAKPIGVAVENMYWKRALEYILRSNMLEYSLHPKYYQVETLVETASPAPQEGAIDFETREIEINAVFFQADYEAIYELGIDWSTFKNGTVGISTFGASNVARDFLRISSSRKINGTVRVDALLKAFESRNRGEVIARPHIRVMEGEQGKIKVGKNFFLTLQDFAGNTRFTEYESGIILTVTPTLYGSNDSIFIYLDLFAERSDVQPDAIGVTKNITESTTRVLLLNGEETVIAGLFSYEIQNLRKGIPILKDLPAWFFGLKYLFGYESRGYTKKELVIFIRARILPKLLSRRLKRVNVRGYLGAQRREFNRYIQENNQSKRIPQNSRKRNGTTRKR
jgi:type IV pilus assembly protein PilQ